MSHELQMISNVTQLNAITVNDACLEMCGCLGNACSYFIEWELLMFRGKCHHVLQWSQFPYEKKTNKKSPCVPLTNSLKSVLRLLPSSRRRPAILFLILRDVQIIRPLIMARRYSVITRRWTSPTRTYNDSKQIKLIK